MISIVRFFVITTVFVTVMFYLMFGIYFIKQQSVTFDLLVGAVKTLIEEDARFITSGLKNLEDIAEYRSLLNRAVYNSDILDAIVFTYGGRVILSTDPSIREVPTDGLIITKYDKKETFMFLQNNKISYKSDVKFFIDGVDNIANIYGIFNHNYIKERIISKNIMLVTMVGLPPLLIALIVSWFIVKFVTKPLKQLGHYAYYSAHSPEEFQIKEIENVRASLEQTFERLEHEKNELFRMSTTDDLCGLSNRTALLERVNWLIKDSERSNSEFALLFIDLDNFKTVNDAFGHKAGDALLKQVSGVLQDLLRETDIIARIGGDEFVVVVEYETERDLSVVVEKVLDRISLPWIVDNKQVNVTSSIGIVTYPKDGKDVVVLMKNADIAMYEAKKLGKNQFHFFTEELNTRVQSEIEIDRDMQRGLTNGEFVLHYQPKIDIRTEVVIGCEALVRWIHPTKGFIPPDKFISAAETNGFIIDLGKWIIEEACKQTKHWINHTGRELTTSINISAKQFVDENFCKFLMKHIELNSLNPSNIDIEITEGMLINKDGPEIETLEGLREHGVTVSIDDFGTGFSSLSYLRKLPVDTLKIDKSFIDDYDNKGGLVILKSILYLAKAFNLTVVAEGVEKIQQAKLLKDLECEYIQGYFYSKPLPKDDFLTFISEDKYVKIFNAVEEIQKLDK